MNPKQNSNISLTPAKTLCMYMCATHAQLAS